MTRIVFDRSVDASLIIRNETVTLREVGFTNEGDTVSINFNRFFGRCRCNAIGIPKEDFVRLCRSFLEDQGMAMLDQPNKLNVSALQMATVDRINSLLEEYVVNVDYIDFEYADEFKDNYFAARGLALKTGVMTEAEVHAKYIEILKREFKDQGNGRFNRRNGWTIIGNKQITELGVLVQHTNAALREQHGVMKISEIKPEETGVTVIDIHRETLYVEVSELELAKEGGE